jgi:tRNA threonylcarbamoyladenosine biosynthesis protein TsaE
MKEFQLTSEPDTKVFAERVARILKGGVTVGLSGGLGAGKTTFVRYLVEALGGKTSHVASPTYTLEHEYRISDGKAVDHWDLYRVSTLPGELFEAPSPKTIRVIEWPERSPELRDEIDLHLTFHVIKDTERRVSLQGRLATDLCAISSEEAP